MDIACLLMFVVGRCCDIALIVAAFKQKSHCDYTPNLVLPWLAVNALEMAVKVVSFA